jgi:hypothetical protein
MRYDMQWRSKPGHEFVKDPAGILRCRRGFKDSRIPEARQIGRYGFELLR